MKTGDTTNSTIPIGQLTAASLARATPTLVSGISVLDEMWTPDDIVARVGGTEVPVSIVDGGNYMGSSKQMMTVADYHRAATTVEDGPRPYLAELSYDKYFPQLAAELVDPPHLVGERFLQRVMYFGSGINSQIHYHPAGSAMLFCIHGRKIVRLFAPDQTKNLYKAARKNFSQVLVSSIGENTNVHDVDRFPKFADAEYLEFVVGPGDVLFIPVYWWHSIQNFDETSLTAVYFWREEWRDTWRRYLPSTLPPRPMLATYTLTTAAVGLGRVKGAAKVGLGKIRSLAAR